ncbi:Mor transcription activator family protein [Lysobacter sp. CA199]|uniref:Mor transcription activator family protein n=1 Tax=Lysobacter sp. CA199 TaxID=3455608 RepID=UPI003F8D4C73
MAKGDRGPNALDFFSDVASQARGLLLEHDVCNEEAARLIGHELGQRMAEHWGGQSLYVPQGVALRVLPIHAEIYRRFTGRNAPELAREYGLSIQWVYQVIKRMRRRDRTQPDLFDGVDGGLFSA